MCFSAYKAGISKLNYFSNSNIIRIREYQCSQKEMCAVPYSVYRAQTMTLKYNQLEDVYVYFITAAMCSGN